MRGGISYIPKRYSKADTKYIWGYDSNKKVCSLFILTQIIYMVGQ